MFKINLRTVTVSEDVDWEKVVKATDGYSGSDIANVCREAALMQMRRKLLNNRGQDLMSLINDPKFQQELEAPITMEDIITSIGNISKTVSPNDLKKYALWGEQYKSC